MDRHTLPFPHACADSIPTPTNTPTGRGRAALPTLSQALHDDAKVSHGYEIIIHYINSSSHSPRVTGTVVIVPDFTFRNSQPSETEISFKVYILVNADEY